MNKCETELTETFITQKIIRDISLFQKYKAFKLKAEIMKSPNKKFCPYPGVALSSNEAQKRASMCNVKMDTRVAMSV